MTSRRRSASPAFRPLSAYVMPVTINEPNTNARIGRSSVTLHLDLDDLLDPEEPNRLHDEAGDDHNVAHALLEEQVHVLRVDEGEREGEKCRQRHQHVPGEPAVRRVHAHLAADLEPLADDVGPL